MLQDCSLSCAGGANIALVIVSSPPVLLSWSLKIVAFLCVGISCHAGVYAHYSFDSDYNDSSGFGRHGSLTDVGVSGNSGITTAAGTHVFGGGAMDFSDDRDYIAIPSKTFSSGVPYTIAFWAQKDSASRDWNMAVGQRDVASFFIAPRGDANNVLRWRSSDSTAGRQADFAAASDTAWHHYAIVAEGTNVRFYLDGGLVATGTGKSTGFIIDTIGEAYTPSSDFDFQGRIDEMWILDEAADAGLISGLYTQNDPGVSPPVGDPSVLRVRIALIGGQSNADGRAIPTDLPSNLQVPQADVDYFYYFQGGSPTLTTLRPGLTETNGFGPAITLGRKLAETYRQEEHTRVAVIKYGNGGTNLQSQWKAGGDNTTSGDGGEYVIFQQTVSQGLAALAVAYPNASLDLEGMTWMQGESDTSGGLENSYETNLRNFIADVRATFSEDLPFIIARLSSQQTALGASGLAKVRVAQDAVAAADPRTVSIDTDSFEMKSDNLHFDAEGQQALGYAFADQCLYYIWALDSFSAADVNAGRAEPLVDADGDGINNRQEFLLLSNPLSGAAALAPGISIYPASVELSYYSTIYRYYAVEHFVAEAEKWEDILPPLIGTGERVTRSIGGSETRGIFRVRSEIP